MGAAARLMREGRGTTQQNTHGREGGWDLRREEPTGWGRERLQGGGREGQRQRDHAERGRASVCGVIERAELLACGMCGADRVGRMEDESDESGLCTQRLQLRPRLCRVLSQRLRRRFPARARIHDRVLLKAEAPRVERVNQRASQRKRKTIFPKLAFHRFK